MRFLKKLHSLGSVSAIRNSQYPLPGICISACLLPYSRIFILFLPIRNTRAYMFVWLIAEVTSCIICYMISLNFSFTARIVSRTFTTASLLQTGLSVKQLSQASQFSSDTLPEVVKRSFLRQTMTLRMNSLQKQLFTDLCSAIGFPAWIFQLNDVIIAVVCNAVAFPPSRPPSVSW